MKKILLILLLSLSICGCCSIPRTADYKELYGFTREEHLFKGGVGKKAKYEVLKDFRGYVIYDDDVDAIKKEVETYISSHPELDETRKNNLKDLKVAIGAGEEEVKIVLGEPVKISRVNNKEHPETTLWIYRLKKLEAFSFFILPLFLSHESYYLYFKDSLLVEIEKHYLSQTVYQSDGDPHERPTK